MPFDETLAGRLRDALARKKNIEERKMFGCICFLLNGNALTGVWKDRLIARIGPDEAEAAMRAFSAEKVLLFSEASMIVWLVGKLMLLLLGMILGRRGPENIGKTSSVPL